MALGLFCRSFGVNSQRMPRRDQLDHRRGSHYCPFSYLGLGYFEALVACWTSDQNGEWKTGRRDQSSSAKTGLAFGRGDVSVCRARGPDVVIERVSLYDVKAPVYVAYDVVEVKKKKGCMSSATRASLS